MKIDKIRIELLSDMCVSDGGIYNSAIDTDICYDSYGFPYIPAKRLKGCLRECAQELKDWKEDIHIEEMFGEKGNQRGKIIIHNAYIKNRESYIRSIRKLPETPLCHPQNILNSYSYIRTQTSIDYETGVANEKTLRTMRAANKGIIFEADVEIYGNYEKLQKELKKCLAVFRHIGIARTRGYGEIQASFIQVQNQTYKDNIKKCVDYKQESTELQYEIYLKEPVICKSVNGQEENSLDYIEGSKILGLIGQMLKDNGREEEFLGWLQEDIYFSNAYLAVNNKRLCEVPASVFEIKNNKENYRNKIYIGNEPVKKNSYGQDLECDDGLQLNQMKHKYVYIDKEGNMECHSVEMEIRYHHSRPKDKSFGRVAEFTGGESQFYQVSSIREGQSFKGFIKASARIIKEIYEYIKNNPVVQLGYGRNGEYGRCNIYVTGMDKQTEQQEKEIQKFYVLLKSPAIIYSSKATYSTDVNDLVKEIFASIFESGKAEQMVSSGYSVVKYVNITAIGGFNVTWGQRKPTIYGFDKGTVICVELEEKIKMTTGHLWIGERCMEGFGEAEIAEITDNRKYQGKIYDVLNSNADENEEDIKKNIPTDISKEPFLQKIASRLFVEFLRYKASANVYLLFDLEKTNESLKPTVSNLLLICKEADKENKSDIEKIRLICKERFSKSSGNKDKKLKNSTKILNHVHPEDSKNERIVLKMLEEFQKNYQIQGFVYEGKEDKWDMEYLKELLIQLKYLMRKKEEECHE